jgi:hypothetical protein
MNNAHFAQVAHAMDMIAALPPLTADPTLPLLARIACLESYYSNLRLLVEFLVRKRDQRDIHRYDFLQWDAPPARTLERLEEEWTEASQQVVHLSKKRVPDATTLIANVHPRKLALLSSLLFEVLEDYCEALSIAQSPWSSQFSGALATCRNSLMI